MNIVEIGQLFLSGLCVLCLCKIWRVCMTRTTSLGSDQETAWQWDDTPSKCLHYRPKLLRFSLNWKTVCIERCEWMWKPVVQPLKAHVASMYQRFADLRWLVCNSSCDHRCASSLCTLINDPSRPFRWLRGCATMERCPFIAGIALEAWKKRPFLQWLQSDHKLQDWA